MAVYPPKLSTFKPEENIIVGNVCLYGAIKVTLAMKSSLDLVQLKLTPAAAEIDTRCKL